MLFYLSDVIIQKQQNPLKDLNLPILHVLNLVDLHQSDLDDKWLRVLTEEGDLSFDVLDQLLLESEVVLDTRHLHDT